MIVDMKMERRRNNIKDSINYYILISLVNHVQNIVGIECFKKNSLYYLESRQLHVGLYAIEWWNC